jgi:hypothetical protein
LFSKWFPRSISLWLYDPHAARSGSLNYHKIKWEYEQIVPLLLLNY